MSSTKRLSKPLVSRRRWLSGALAMPFLCHSRWALAQLGDWENIVQKAAGTKVRFNAWGGDQRINDYIAWAGREIKERAGVEVRHVKLADTAEAAAGYAEPFELARIEASYDRLLTNFTNLGGLAGREYSFHSFLTTPLRSRWKGLSRAEHSINPLSARVPKAPRRPCVSSLTPNVVRLHLGPRRMKGCPSKFLLGVQ
jgi:hypothetical protein